MTKCQFCEKYGVLRTLDRDFKESKKEYTVSIVRRAWTKESGKRNACGIVFYRNQGIGFKLNYCPECGRELKGKVK